MKKMLINVILILIMVFYSTSIYANTISSYSQVTDLNVTIGSLLPDYGNKFIQYDAHIGPRSTMPYYIDYVKASNSGQLSTNLLNIFVFQIAQHILITTIKILIYLHLCLVKFHSIFIM